MALEINIDDSGSVKITGDAKDIKSIGNTNIKSLKELASEYYKIKKDADLESSKKIIEAANESVVAATDAEIAAFEKKEESRRNQSKKNFKQFLKFGAIIVGSWYALEGIGIGVDILKRKLKKSEKTDDTTPSSDSAVLKLVNPSDNKKKNK